MMKKFLITALITNLFINLLGSTQKATPSFNFPSKKFVIVAHGNSVNEQLLRQEIQNSTVIALDGASKYLDEKAIPYHVLLGDFDSVSPDKVLGTFDDITDHTPPYIHNGHLIVNGHLIIPSKNQDLTDLGKGIEFCDKHDAQKITLFGALGDREDHSELNRNLLKRYYKFDRPLIMRSSCQT